MSSRRMCRVRAWSWSSWSRSRLSSEPVTVIITSGGTPSGAYWAWTVREVMSTLTLSIRQRAVIAMSCSACAKRRPAAVSTSVPFPPRSAGRPYRGQPLDEHAAAVRAYAADQRAKVDVLASVLEDIAANGSPSRQFDVPWEVARDALFARLAGEKPQVA